MANNRGQFKPGQSGNPGGRPKVVADLKEAAREHSQEAIDTLVEIMRSKSSRPEARALASNALLDRGYGKPVQSTDLKVLSDNPLAQLLEELDGKTRGITPAALATQ